MINKYIYMGGLDKYDFTLGHIYQYGLYNEKLGMLNDNRIHVIMTTNDVETFFLPETRLYYITNITVIKGTLSYMEKIEDYENCSLLKKYIDILLREQKDITIYKK